jgi:hypothetical protein
VNPQNDAALPYKQRVGNKRGFPMRSLPSEECEKKEGTMVVEKEILSQKRIVNVADFIKIAIAEWERQR